MARRRSRKKSAPSRKRRPLGRWLLIGGVVMFGLLVVGAFAVYIGLRSYLHSARFSGMVSDKVSDVLDAEGEFEPFRWTGTTAYTNSFKATGYDGALFSKFWAESIEGRINFDAVRRGVWEVANIEVSRVNVLIASGDRKAKSTSDIGDSGDSGGGDGGGGSGGLLSGFIPEVVELKRAGIGELNFDIKLEEIKVTGRGTSLEVKPTASTEVFRVAARGGTISTAGYPPLDLIDAEVRAGAGKALIDRSEFTLYDDAKLDANGEVDFAEGEANLDIEARLRDLEIAEVLPEDWIKKLKGTLAADVTISGQPSADGELVLAGDVTLKGGVLEAIPVLERADEMLGSSRFRRLAFSDFEVNFERRGEQLDLLDFFALSPGTICLKGRASLPTEADPSGIYMLGITTETIKWLPLIKKAVIEVVFAHDRDVAFERVFGSGSNVAKPPEGFRWAIAQIDPSAPDPYTADLREQFSDAGGTAILAQLMGAGEEVVEALQLLEEAARAQGVELVSVLSAGASEEGGMFTPGNLTRAAAELGVASAVQKVFDGVLDGATGIIDAGVGLLDSLFR